ncbi:hypothetical protein [Hyphomicrobium sulfonivorans]|uniref:hypothetical protein n=2 Tax=Hyphomicrobium sulfonivorans TaxID=121290 RepID=UPI00156E4985|nr:hypothetical protein [Hyphomicrobium sulfonivorans]MBI1650389.1 hypothetical protein [Hyphomicrobium sulfonivorans]
MAMQINHLGKTSNQKIAHAELPGAYIPGNALTTALKMVVRIAAKVNGAARYAGKGLTGR